eukprot:816921-Pelagomonas_calceolata.AAC.6
MSRRQPLSLQLHNRAATHSSVSQRGSSDLRTSLPSLRNTRKAMASPYCKHAAMRNGSLVKSSLQCLATSVMKSVKLNLVCLSSAQKRAPRS